MGSGYVLGPTYDAAVEASKIADKAEMEAARHMNQEPYRTRSEEAKLARRAAWALARKVTEETIAAREAEELAPRPSAHQELVERLDPERIRRLGGLREALTRED